jgi:hypothetical protein
LILLVVIECEEKRSLRYATDAFLSSVRHQHLHKVVVEIEGVADESGLFLGQAEYIGGGDLLADAICSSDPLLRSRAANFLRSSSAIDSEADR